MQTYRQINALRGCVDERNILEKLLKQKERSEAEFKEFEPRLTFKPQQMYGCIKFFKMKAGAQLKLVFEGFETRLKFIKFGHCGLITFTEKQN